MANQNTNVPDKGFFGHPKGLSTLFFTEFWERFSYYGMKAILAYYIYYSVTKGGFGLDQSTALQIVSIYGALIYMTGTIGGWVADRITGTRNALFYGGVLIMIGHILMAIPGNFTLLMVALLFIIIGSGLLKPNISTTVGMLYEKNDSRIDSGFTLFYMSINMGALISPLIIGWLQVNVGFHAGFAAAAIGMFIGLVIYVLTGNKFLGDLGKDVPDPLSKSDKLNALKYLTIAAIIIAALVIIAYLTDELKISNFSNVITLIGVLLPTIYIIVILKSKKVEKSEKRNVFAYIPLFIASVAFWMIQEQGSTILAQFSDKKTELSMANLTNGLIDFHIPAAWFQSLNPMFILIFAPIFSLLWVKLGRFNPSTVIKFALGVILAAAAYLLMIIPLTGGQELINPIWLVLSFMLITLGELCISPIGLSTTTRLAPKAFTSQMMSVWFLSNAMAQGLNAQMVKIYSIISTEDYFLYSGLTALGIGVLLILVSPKLKNLMSET